MEVATKASHTVGLKPISIQDINKHLGNNKSSNEAREYAVRDYMINFLQFTGNDLIDVDILDTKVSTKGDSTVYVVF